MKIIICGPPHSGKTVMINSLHKLLPTEGVQTIRANADGEGYWASEGNPDDVQKVRVKGDNTPEEFAEWTKQISDAKANIVLVDIGGKLQDDKIPLFEAADSFVVLCSDQEPDLMVAWKSFGEAHGCRCLACLTSKLVGEDEVKKLGAVIEDTITHLERGTERTDSKLLQELAGLIINMAKSTTARPFDSHDSQTFNAFDMAYALNCYTQREIKINTIEGEEVSLCRNIRYETRDIDNIRDYVAKWQAERKLSNVKVYGANAQWVAVTIIFALIDGGAEAVELFDISTWQYVRLRKLRVATSPLTISVSAFDSQKDIMEVSILNEQGKPRSLSIDELDRCSIPPIDASHGIVVSGRLPNWLLASICLTLPNKVIFVRKPGAKDEYIKVRG